MKIKSILAILAVSIMSVFGQGQVQFQNNSISTPIYIFEGATLTLMPTTPYAFSFYFVYGLSPGNMNFTSPTYFNSTNIAGRMGGTGNIPFVLSTPGRTLTYFQLFAYSTSAGSYAAALVTPGMYSYQSGIISLSPSITPEPGTPMFGSNPGTQWQSFTMFPVPEPSTIALGCLAVGALFFAHRHKQ